MFEKKLIAVVCVCSLLMASSLPLQAQYVSGNGNDATTPLHLMKPAYETPYGETTPQSIKTVLDRIHQYLEGTTPMALVLKTKPDQKADPAKADTGVMLQQGDFRLYSYEWGVTYTGMLEAALATGDKKFADYTINRVNFLGQTADYYRKRWTNKPSVTPVRTILEPHALDDAGAVAASMIKAMRQGAGATTTKPMVDNYLQYIMTKEFRLKDGTLARNRPLPNTLWLDDLYMSLPAIAQMGLLTGENQYFDEAIKQFRLFTGRMFNAQKQLYMHGWVQDMEPHPQFHWARANGWALMTMVELLDALPQNHTGRNDVLTTYRLHVEGLARLQDKTGFWHQLLDKNDSYLETSATAIYAYCIARGINKGWLDAKAYGPMALLAWNAASTKVNEQGQVEGTCVGTGMGFDPAFYYYRPVSKYAAHGYGPMLLAGAEMYRLLSTHPYKLNDSAIQF